MESINELCKGCNTNDTCGIPYHELKEDANRCPCTRCLVKVVCDSRSCKDYGDFIKSLRMH